MVVITRGREAGEHQSFLVDIRLRPRPGAARGASHQSFLVVVFAEYLVVTQIVAVTHTEPVHTQQSSSYPAHACSVR